MAQAMLDQTNFSMIQSQSRVEQEQKDMEILLSTFTENTEGQHSQNFSQDNNVVTKNSQNAEMIIAILKLKQEIC